MKITKEVQDKLYAKLTEGIRDNLTDVNESDLGYATMNCLSTCVDFAEEQCKEKDEQIEELKIAIVVINRRIDSYWNADKPRPDYLIKKINEAQIECKKVLEKYKAT